MHKITIEILPATLGWLMAHKWQDVSLEGYIGAMVDNEVRKRLDAEKAVDNIDLP